MAASISVSVGDSAPVLLVTGPIHVTLINKGPFTLYIGNSLVDVNNGFPLFPNATPLYINVELARLEAIYGICDSGTSDVRVLTVEGR